MQTFQRSLIRACWEGARRWGNRARHHLPGPSASSPPLQALIPLPPIRLLTGAQGQRWTSSHEWSTNQCKCLQTTTLGRYIFCKTGLLFIFLVFFFFSAHKNTKLKHYFNVACISTPHLNNMHVEANESVSVSCDRRLNPTWFNTS